MNWLTKNLPPGDDPMGADDDQKAAWDLFRKAYERQMKGEFEEAIKLYTDSIDLYPTAEAYTFRGWTHSFMGLLDEAIEDCHRAIAVDPDFGNPYNDIGAYLIEQDKLDEAIPWLTRAIQAKRYDCYCFPHFNLGRIYEHQGAWTKAVASYRQAYAANTDYVIALQAANRLQGLLD